MYQQLSNNFQSRDLVPLPLEMIRHVVQAVKVVVLLLRRQPMGWLDGDGSGGGGSSSSRRR